MHLPCLLSSFLLFFTILGQNLSFSVSAINEVQSLLEFKKGIDPDPDGLVSNSWDRSSIESNGCPKSWLGIFCEEDSGFVTAIVLDGLGLTGDLKFVTLNGLKMLKNLSLSGNNFTGRIVPLIGTLTSLQYLDLSGNKFYGPVPAKVMELWGLGYMNLSSNNFTGGFPTGIRNLQQLKALDLHSNGFWGDVGNLLSELRNPEYVDFSSNLFTGGLLMGSQNLSSLANTVRHLNMSFNRLNGEFFSNESIGLFRNLEVLDLGLNQLTGMLPSFGMLPALRVLRLSSNRFHGSIPFEFFGSSMPLSVLDLSGNGFSGVVQNINSTTLKVLNLSSNALSGSLPSTLGSCMVVDLSKNAISGDISAIQSWGDILETIDLHSNALSGSFPENTSQFVNLASINTRNNSLEGIIPPELGSYPKLTTIDLSLNKLKGPIPSSLFTSLTLTSLHLSGNQFTGTIPLQNSHSVQSLVVSSDSPLESLDLSDNSFTGDLPPEIGNMETLKLLKLGKNSLSGRIPVEIAKLNLLEHLDLSVNKFEGNIPDSFPSSLHIFNVSYNNLSGVVPENLRGFPNSSFFPGNRFLIISDLPSSPNNAGGVIVDNRQHRHMKSGLIVAIILGSFGAITMIIFVLVAYYRMQLQEHHGGDGFSGQTTGRDVTMRRFTRPTLFKFRKNSDPPPTSLSFSNDHLLTSDSRSMPRQKESATEIAECGFSDVREGSSGSMMSNVPDNCPLTTGWKSSPGSPLSSAPHFTDSFISEQPATLNVYSPDRLAGELFFLDGSLRFTAEELSRAPAEVLGRSSHGTLYKATLDSGRMLTVKWLRVGLVKRKKEFSKEAKRIGSIRHPNIVSLRAYYWGPREQERLILADYINGESLALHLYESTPRRYPLLSFSQRLKIAVDVARCLYYLHHDKGLPHGNLKPTNILLAGPDLTAQLADYGLHRLMTPVGTAEQILNLGALGYRAPELATSSKPFPSLKADVYAFGVILMEMLTRRSAGDIISGQSGAVDLTDWVRLCSNEGRGIDCFDREIAGLEESPKAMDELLAVSLRCTLPVNERPHIRTVFEDLCSITV
ncbi:leucine-rich receptor-like protein kinase family protein [Tasmannia lanceolata]|uniref:leucine-rich receptor-like protein kinase family protein n=1 Tax=Tasmannia lanceolata TaxID=3420 RepID=UPI004063DCBA